MKHGICSINLLLIYQSSTTMEVSELNVLFYLLQVPNFQQSL